jgi:hypothetical protein
MAASGRMNRHGDCPTNDVRWISIVVLAAGVYVAGCSRQASTVEAATVPSSVNGDVATSPAAEPVRASFRNVHLHVAPGVILEIHALDGALISTTPGRPPSFDDQRSFTLHVDSAEVAMTPASLSRLLNDHVFAYENSPISNIDVSIEGNRLKQKGTLHKGAAIPFTIVADLSATPDGRIRLHPVNVKTAGIPSQGLMKLFGIELDDLIKSNRAHGIEIRDNDFLLSTDHLLPAPALNGHLTSVRIERDRIVEVFGGKAEASTRGSGNYMRYRGGTLRFGKLTMTNADMDLIDADPRDPFDFSQPEYMKQLVAGYSKNTPSGGLRVFMPDLNDAGKADLRPTGTTGR